MTSCHSFRRVATAADPRQGEQLPYLIVALGVQKCLELLKGRIICVVFQNAFHVVAVIGELFGGDFDVDLACLGDDEADFVGIDGERHDSFSVFAQAVVVGRRS